MQGLVALLPDYLPVGAFQCFQSILHAREKHLVDGSNSFHANFFIRGFFIRTENLGTFLADSTGHGYTPLAGGNRETSRFSPGSLQVTKKNFSC
jgi:hypothetical protein